MQQNECFGLLNCCWAVPFVWCVQKSIYFDALTSKEARRYFRKFMDKYNEGELSEKYYDGTYTAASTSDRTGYTWKVRSCRTTLRVRWQ